MARSFTAAGHGIAVGTRAIPATTGTLALWFWPTWVQTDGIDHVLFDVRNNGSNVFQIYKSSASFLYAGWITGGVDRRVAVASAGYTLVQNAWNSLVLTWDTGTGNAALRLNGTQIGTMSSVVTFASTAARYIGNYSGLALDARGRLAEVVICDRVWSANEAAAFHAGILPHELGPVDSYWPLWGGDASEQDLSGNGATGTVTGATRANHPPVLPASRQWWGSDVIEGAPPPALQLAGTAGGVGATTATLQVTRRITGSAAGLAVVSATPQVSRRLAVSSSGTGDSAGSLIVSRPLSGAASGAGAPSAAVEIRRLLSGLSAGVGSTSAVFFIPPTLLSGVCVGVGTTSATLTIGRTLQGNSSGAGVITGTLLLRRLLQGSAAGVGSTTGRFVSIELTGPICYGGSVTVRTAYGGTVTVRLRYGGSVDIRTQYGGTARICGDE